MVIREKALVREMKEAYKRGGYTVLVRPNGRTVICSPYWSVEIDNHEVPREALSLMALHMGFLPESGDAYKIYKGDKTPAVQEEVFFTCCGVGGYTGQGLYGPRRETSGGKEDGADL